MFRILFVCTGNTCRSPMAEGLCRSFLDHFQLQQVVEVTSAGLHTISGEPVSQDAATIMSEKGIDLSGHRTTCLTAAQVRWADLILTMEERQRLRLLEKFPEAAGKTFVLKEYVTAPETAAGAMPDQARASRMSQFDIPDPFGQSMEAYRGCAEELGRAIADVCIDLNRRLQRVPELSPDSKENR